MDNEYKNFRFGVFFSRYGLTTVRVPIDFSKEEAERYVRDNWDSIELPLRTDIVEGSEKPDFDSAEFTEYTEFTA